MVETIRKPAPRPAWRPHARQARALSEEDILARVLYRDPLMLVIDKPAGLPVHAGPGGGPNLEQHFEYLRFGLPKPPSLAHRLDRDTSGCLVLGRHRKALAKLGRLFASGRAEKTYWAIVEGEPPEPQGRIELPLAKVTPKSGWRMVVTPDGQPAITDYRVMGKADGRSWLELRPRTGRTHQIRVHCAALGCPIVDDPVYGSGSLGSDRRFQHLHARAILLPLYPSRDPIAVVAPPPPHMAETLARCGFVTEAAAPTAA
jgi:tRNA pseudouridine32 synthase/23S rRNA pseudouridine746 synthase/23S rRNA pseudouridine1911/1915/1917 synthase